MLLRVLLTLVLWFGASSIAVADTEDVICVQNQLNASGFDAGPADGIIGPRTAGALRRFGNARGMATTMPFNILSAATYCRRLGLLDPALRAAWPANRQTLDFAFTDSVPGDVQARIQERMPVLLELVVRQLGLDLASAEHVVVGTEPTALRRLIDARLPYRLRNIEQRLRDDCSREGRIGAAASLGLMMVCVSDDTPVSREDLEFVLTHEAVHLVQLQVAGLSGRRNRSGRRSDGEMPMWFIEGMADLIAARHTTARSEASLRHSLIARYDGQPIPDLATLDPREALLHDRIGVYRVGAIAVSFLVEDFGYEALGELLEHVGDGLTFEDAFETQFGVALDAFSSAFQQRVRPAVRRSTDGMDDIEHPVQCVQALLGAAGHDAGPIDGRIGSRTSAALQAFRRANGMTRGIALSDANAAAWCRRIGLADIALRVHWPSLTLPVEVTVTAEIDPGIATRFVERARRIHRRASRQLDTRLAGRDAFFVTTRIDAVRDSLRAHLGVRLTPDLEAQLIATCTDVDEFSYFTGPGYALICVAPGTVSSASGILRRVDGVMAEAAARLVRQQIAGVAPIGSSAGEILSRDGPVWLHEGYAWLFRSSVELGMNHLSLRRRFLSQLDAREMRPLRQLQLREALLYDPEAVRVVGALATSVLIEEHRVESYGRLLDAIGAGVPFVEAFEAEYGMTPTDFNNQFDAWLAAR